MNLLQNHKMTIFTFCILSVWTLFGGSSPAQAQTPDTETPAEESVCDLLKDDGVTKSLYGLCIAFCEAQDWETNCLDDPGACGQLGDQLLRIYDKRKKDADPSMPCIVSANQCPCWDGTQRSDIPGSTLADMWLMNAPANCEGNDQCEDIFDDEDVEFQSEAFCKQDPENQFSTSARKFPSSDFGNCNVIVGNIGPGQTVFIILDIPTAELCLQEHDAFTAGGTFPDYQTDACGLPTPF